MANGYKWSYDELTKHVELSLLELADQAKRMTDDEGRLVVRQWAYGVFSYWSTITTGRRPLLDFERIEELAERVGRTHQ